MSSAPPPERRRGRGTLQGARGDYPQERALADAASALATAGLHERARRAATDAETAARSTAEPDNQAEALAAVAATLATARLHDQAKNS